MALFYGSSSTAPKAGRSDTADEKSIYDIKQKDFRFPHSCPKNRRDLVMRRSPSKSPAVVPVYPPAIMSMVKEIYNN
jgi:hypothetical protein